VNTAPTPLLTTKVTMVKVVGTKAEFDEILASAGDKAVVVDFYATWCGPCKVIAPYYEELSKQFTNVVFIKVGMERKEGRREGEFLTGGNERAEGMRLDDELRRMINLISSSPNSSIPPLTKPSRSTWTRTRMSQPLRASRPCPPSKCTRTGRRSGS
jgi:thiol-disulfide isomerase/thioredoxin